MSFHYPTGVGFETVRQSLFDKYSHNPEAGARAAHSIYFQVLGNHGFVGLGLFLLIWWLTWRHAGWLRVHAANIPQAQWCADLGSMVQVSLAGFFVGGAFLSLAYFDLPYNIMMLVAIARVWVVKKSWEREPAVEARWWSLPGLATSARAS
jgi:probable O-glycosylation ligase (exosortase A-associated)